MSKFSPTERAFGTVNNTSCGIAAERGILNQFLRPSILLMIV